MGYADELKALDAAIATRKQELQDLIAEKAKAVNEVNEVVYDAKAQAEKIIADAEAKAEEILNDAEQAKTNAGVANQEAEDLLHTAKAGTVEVEEARTQITADRTELLARVRAFERQKAVAQEDFGGEEERLFGIKKQLEHLQTGLDAKTAALTAQDTGLRDLSEKLSALQGQLNKQQADLNMWAETLIAREKAADDAEAKGKALLAEAEGKETAVVEQVAADQQILAAIEEQRGLLTTQEQDIKAKSDDLSRQQEALIEQKRSIADQMKLLIIKQREVEQSLANLKKARGDQ